MFISHFLFFPIVVVWSSVQSVGFKSEVVISFSQCIQTIFDEILNFQSKLGRRRHHYLDLGKRTSVRCTALPTFGSYFGMIGINTPILYH